MAKSYQMLTEAVKPLLSAILFYAETFIWRTRHPVLSKGFTASVNIWYEGLGILPLIPPSNTTNHFKCPLGSSIDLTWETLMTPGCQGQGQIDFMPLETLFGVPRTTTYSILEKIGRKSNFPLLWSGVQ